MFTINQIISSARLRRDFYSTLRWITGNPQALLITQKNKEPLVLVSGRIFEDLVHNRYANHGNNPSDNP